VLNATNAKGVFRFIFRTIRHFIVKGAQAMQPVSIGFFCVVAYQMTKYLCQRLSCICHGNYPLINNYFATFGISLRIIKESNAFLHLIYGGDGPHFP
jgi:hypothetical protein